MISITLYMYIFASQDFSFCFGNVGTKITIVPLLGLESAGDSRRKCWSQERQTNLSNMQAFVGVRLHKMLVINHAVLCSVVCVSFSI